jgi:hypothetical protein
LVNSHNLFLLGPAHGPIISFLAIGVGGMSSALNFLLKTFRQPAFYLSRFELLLCSKNQGLSFRNDLRAYCVFCWLVVWICFNWSCRVELQLSFVWLNHQWTLLCGSMVRHSHQTWYGTASNINFFSMSKQFDVDGLKDCDQLVLERLQQSSSMWVEHLNSLLHAASFSLKSDGVCGCLALS